MRNKSKWVILLGVILILCSLGFMMFLHISTINAQQETADTVAYIKKILPEKTIGSVDSYSSIEMPSLEFDNKNIIGLLEIPATDTALPIEACWNKKTLISIPQRFSGTVYDNSLVVGGYDRKEQFDCLKKLDSGNTVTITDMTGSQFSYKVELMERKKSATKEVLQDASYDLTLFVRDANSMEYIIVRCSQ